MVKQWLVSSNWLVGLLLALVMLFPSVQASEKTVLFTSLEWPPYSGEALREQGASVAVARAAFAVMGYQLDVHFYPWARAVGLAKKRSSPYHGYFPEYYSSEIEQEFLFSDPIGSGPLGFAERAVKPIFWRNLTDLEPLKIGVVRGYVNTKVLDERIAQGRIKAEPVVADVDNLKKLAAGRLDLAVIDHYVFRYLIKHDPTLSDIAPMLALNAKPLELKKLFLCFKNTEEGKELLAIFNEGLKRVDVQAIMREYMSAYE